MGVTDKRYLVFGYSGHRAKGGMNDKIGTFKTIEEARKFIRSQPYRYFDIYDRKLGCEIIL